MDFELQRRNMVESQVRPSDMTDRRIMRAMLSLPREAFAADDTRALAYMEQDLPVGSAVARGQRRALLAPRTLARLIQLLDIDEGDRVLEIGCATGYGAAVMARLAGDVIALEADAALAERARRILADHGGGKVAVVSGPHAAGWPAQAPYAAILVGGAVPEVPAALLDQLQDGACLAAVVASGGIAQICQWRRIGSSFAMRCVGEGGARPLPGFERERGFVF